MPQPAVAGPSPSELRVSTMPIPGPKYLKRRARGGARQETPGYQAAGRTTAHIMRRQPPGPPPGAGR
ncbi:hypothetical protein VUR80DRAFT_722 [Thermomyces stellatus]